MAVTGGDNELAVARVRGRVLRDGVLGRRPVHFVQQGVTVVRGGLDVPERVPGVLPSRAQAVPEPPQGHLDDHLRCARRDPRGPLAICVPQEVEDDLGVRVLTHGRWAPYCRGREAATPSSSGTVPEMATAHVRVTSAARATLVACLQGPPPDASEEVWPRASGIQ